MVSIFLPVYQDTINTSRPADTIPVIRNVPSGNNTVVNPVPATQGSTRITSTSTSAKKTPVNKTDQVLETPALENPVQIE
ncbi:MAG TPA: hypothetical protein VHI78_01240, partial [Bacteroidales bacterium]|nr:hypothetical protein [Bacteroidales bacterium]